MKKQMIIAAATVFLAVGAVQAMQQHGGGHVGGASGSQPMDHSQMGQPSADGAFHHMGQAEGIKADFQVMSLANMNVQDTTGATHHVMVKLFAEGSGEPITDVAGKVKIISPSQQETVIDLTNFNGTFAANFKAEEPGQYGIICLLKAGDKKPMYKFWYPRE